MQSRATDERLQKLIAKAGLASRRQAERWIEEGRVRINGRVAQLGDRANPAQDRIEINGRLLAAAEEKYYVLLNKPLGFVTTAHDPQGRRTVLDLLSEIPVRLFPVGRLDLNTEGLLLLTNDGELAQQLLHPRFKIAKTYRVKIKGSLTGLMQQQLEQGVLLDDGPTSPARVAHVHASAHNTWFDLTIHEGRNRQVRRMCEQVGCSVSALKRTALAFLELGDLKSGEYRFLRPAEVQKLKSFPVDS
ncbi:MAG: rRNA pseudouridine synthase [Desulfuromonadaceae bacterium]|nr:rRNA pseudouridine synthase [Desulfuromonadaceae bacterium]